MNKSNIKDRRHIMLPLPSPEARTDRKGAVRRTISRLIAKLASLHFLEPEEARDIIFIIEDYLLQAGSFSSEESESAWDDYSAYRYPFI